MSSDSFGGCFNESSSAQDQCLGRSFPITNALLDGRISITYIRDTPARHGVHKNTEHPTAGPIGDALQNAPPASRAWVSQERFLSQRVLHFTSDQLVWECRRGIRSEDGLRMFSLEQQSAPGSLLQNSAAYEQNTAEGKTLFAWYRDIIQFTYSGRQLSHGSDALPARSGLARYFSRWLSHEYIAGTWTSSQLAFLFGLAWRRSDRGYARPWSPRGPSWSWVAVHGAVAWPVSFRPVKDVSVRFFTQGPSGDFLGSTVYAPVCLTTILGQVTVWPAKPMPSIGTRTSWRMKASRAQLAFESNRRFQQLTGFTISPLFGDQKSFEAFKLKFLGHARASKFRTNTQTDNLAPIDKDNLVVNCFEEDTQGRRGSA